MKKETLFKLLSAGLITLASLSFISSTLAWYAASTMLHVESIDVEIKSERDLRISTSTDEDTFKSELTYDELEKAGLFMPVSTMFSSKWENEENPTPKFYEYSNIFTPESGIPYGPREIDKGFFQQRIYLLTDDDLYVSIDPENTYFNPNEEANVISAKTEMKHFPDLTEEEVVRNLNDIVKAIRFSLYDVSANKYYIIDPYKDSVVYYGGALDNDKDEYFDTYADENGVVREVVYGEINDRSLAVYEDVGDTDIEIEEGERFSCFTAMHKRKTKMFKFEESLSNGLTIKWKYEF